MFDESQGAKILLSKSQKAVLVLTPDGKKYSIPRWKMDTIVNGGRFQGLAALIVEQKQIAEYSNEDEE